MTSFITGIYRVTLKKEKSVFFTAPENIFKQGDALFSKL
jgi:hypothetical protein